MHPNSLVNSMTILGYDLGDMLPAFPGRDITYIDRVLRDNALALSRPVISYGLLGIHECRTDYFNVSVHGYRSIGEDQPWPPSPDFCNVFFFGGSTALGYNVEDRHAIPHFLHAKLKRTDRPTQVYNFGCGNYASRHEVLRLLDLIDHGIVPDVALFFDGFNDSFYAFGNSALVKALDGLYQSEKRRRRTPYVAAVLDYACEALVERRHPLPSAVTERLDSIDSDVQRLVSPEGIAETLSNTAPASTVDHIPPGLCRLAKTVWGRWLDSSAMIRALAERHGFQALFAWQPVPLFATRSEARIMERLFSLFPNSVLCGPVYKWLHASGFPNLPRDIHFHDLSRLGVDRAQVSYVDLCHYNAAFAEIISERLAEAVSPLIFQSRREGNR